MEFGLRDWAVRQPQRPALEFEDGTIVSYGDLEKRANRFAHLWRQSGLRRGDHCAVLFANTWHMIAAVWGAYRAGIYFTPIANTFSPSEVAYVAENSQAKVVVCDPALAAAGVTLPEQLTSCRRFLALGELPGYENLNAIFDALPETPIEDESPGALMLYSSGTTGAPKGILRPLPTLEDIADSPPPFAGSLIWISRLTSETRYLSPTPLYHAAPLRWTLSVSAVGGCSVIMDRFDPARALDLLEKRAITASQWVPTMFRRMLDLPDDRRRRFRAPLHANAIHAAAPCPPAIKRAMIDWWGPIINEYYAGSEGLGLTWISSAEWLARPGSVGWPLLGDIHIIDEAGTPCRTGEPGTIYFGGDRPLCLFQRRNKNRQPDQPTGVPDPRRYRRP